MDMDQIKGKIQNAFGKAEEAVGEAIGNQSLANAGAEDRVKGAATETWGNTKDTVRSATDTAHTHVAAQEEHAAVQTDSVRNRMAAGAEHLKDSINARLDHVKHNEHAERDDLRAV